MRFRSSSAAAWPEEWQHQSRSSRYRIEWRLMSLITIPSSALSEGRGRVSPGSSSAVACLHMAWAIRWSRLGDQPITQAAAGTANIRARRSASQWGTASHSTSVLTSSGTQFRERQKIKLKNTLGLTANPIPFCSVPSERGHARSCLYHPRTPFRPPAVQLLLTRRRYALLILPLLNEPLAPLACRPCRLFLA